MTLPINQVVQGNCIEVMRSWPAECINFVMFSPPYWGLRNYGENVNTVWGGDPKCEHDWVEREVILGGYGQEKSMSRGKMTEGQFLQAAKAKKSTSSFCSKCGAWYGQLGLEPDYRMYIEHLAEVGREIKRVLRKDGSVYIVIGDTYAGSGCGAHDYRGETSTGITRERDREKYQNKPVPQLKTNIPAKCKLLMPYRVALALVDDGWICRNDITWYKRNSMPSSAKDRLTCQTERVFHLIKNRKYYYDLDAIREPHSTATIKRITQPTIMRQKGGFKQDELNPLGLGKSNFNRPAEMAKSLARKFNPRVRDVKRGKFGTTAEGKLRASKEEVESYQYPEKLVKHDIAVGRVGNFSYTDPLHEKEYHPAGKNPGDVVKYSGDDSIYPKRLMRFGKAQSTASLHRDGNGVYHPLGKNPGDVVLDDGIRKQPLRPDQQPTRWERGKNIWEERFAEGGKNPGDFWSITTKPFKGAHFAVYPEALCERPIKSSCPAQVCRKCGRPRERIVKSKLPPLKDAEIKGMSSTQYDAHNAFCLGQRRQAYRALGFESPPAPKTIGWTNCGCKNYYCYNCKTFITQEILNNNCAIQRSRKKEGVSEGILAEPLQREIAKVSQTQLRNLWERILREKDATVLFEEMRCSASNQEGNTSCIPKGGTFAKLQGGDIEQRRLQSHLDRREGDDGTSLGDGTTPKEKIRKLGGCSSQERCKVGQQSRESRDSNQEQTQRINCLPILSKLFQFEIVCPFCFSENVEIESAGFEPGIVLDPMAGSGTTLAVAKKLGRRFIGIDLNEDYVRMSRERLARIESPLEAWA